jgi:Outer membrane protein beta-barrel domain
LRTRLVGAFILAALSLSAAPALAQSGYVVPYVGANFGGNSTCSSLVHCSKQTMNLGVAFASWPGHFGFEEDLGWARNFYGTDNGGGSLFVVMSNLLVGNSAPEHVRPYVVAGLGLVKSNVSFSAPSIFSVGDNNLGYDVGAGVIVMGGSVGIRADVRNIGTFHDVSLGTLSNLSPNSIRFWRATAGVVFQF